MTIGAVTIGAVTAAVVALPGAAAAPPSAAVAAATDTGQLVAKTLAGYAGPAGFADDSSTTACMSGPTAEWLAYRTDGIMLRTTHDATAVRNVVADALAGTQSGEQAMSAQIGTPEIIQFPGEGVTPVVHVPLQATAGEPVPVVDLARRLHRRHVTASPNYLLRPTGNVGMWPNGHPTPTEESTPVRTPATVGAGATVLVYDTGVPPADEGTIVPALTQLTAGDVEVVDAEAPFGVVDRYFAGHTLAIAGVLHALAPGAVIKAARITGPDGLPTDLTAARRTAATLRTAERLDAWPEVIVDAFGSPACDLEPGVTGTTELVPVGLEAAVEAAAVRDESVFVASASNTGTDRRFYPAAFDEVLAVGALDAGDDPDATAWTSPSRAGHAADFSNYGDWVDVWAPGVDLAVPHLDGFSFETDGPVLGGQASVDGTSFAAPYVGALVAEQLAANPTWSPDRAVDSLLSSGAPCTADMGSGTAMALTSMSATATTGPVGPLPRCTSTP